MDFDSQSGVVQPWTSDAVALAAGIRRFTEDGQSRISGTAIFDSIYRACFNQFRTLDSTNSGNFILLFSDGEDNASRTSLDEAVAMCQRTNTAIYIFRAEPETGFSTGSRTLAELASKSGGRVFYDDDSDAAIYSDLQIIEANLRNQYRLVYTPAELQRDGSFHRVELETPQRVGSIAIRAIIHNGRSTLVVKARPSDGEAKFRWVFHPAEAVSPRTDPKFTKPAPDGYLEGARRLHVSADRCLVFEDADSGVRAARAAGVHAVVGVSERSLKSDADVVVSSLAAVRWQDRSVAVSARGTLRRAR